MWCSVLFYLFFKAYFSIFSVDFMVLPVFYFFWRHNAGPHKIMFVRIFLLTIPCWARAKPWSQKISSDDAMLGQAKTMVVRRFFLTIMVLLWPSMVSSEEIFWRSWFCSGPAWYRQKKYSDERDFVWPIIVSSEEIEHWQNHKINKKISRNML